MKGVFPMSTKAVVYATGMTGHTKAVAEYIAKKLEADVVNLKDQAKPDLSKYDTVIVGTGVHAGKPYKPVVELLQDKAALEGKKVSLFVLCMYKDEKGKTQLDKVSKELGVEDAVFFNSKDTSGSPKVDEYAARLRSPWASP